MQEGFPLQGSCSVPHSSSASPHHDQSSEIILDMIVERGQESCGVDTILSQDSTCNVPKGDLPPLKTEK